MTPREALANLESFVKAGPQDYQAYVEAMSFVRCLRSAVEDQERLDWLEAEQKTLHCNVVSRRWYMPMLAEHVRLRSALDAARTPNREPTHGAD